jgi:hypothetical protein
MIDAEFVFCAWSHACRPASKQMLRAHAKHFVLQLYEHKLHVMRQRYELLSGL